MDPASPYLLLRNFLIALLIGALVGVEREKHKAASQGLTFGGLRTFILFAEAGAVAAWLSVERDMPWLFVATVVAVAAVVTIAYVLESRINANPDALGLTTELAAITVCLLGGAVMYGHAEIAVGLAIATSAVLAFKQPLHQLVEKLGMDDIYAALKLLIATFIVLPVLPSEAIDPWGALNPYQLWLLVILVSSLSLVGYVAVRWLGSAPGALVTGLTGGLVSSTAVSLAFARDSRANRHVHAGDSLAAGILLAWVMMFVRIGFAVTVVNSALLAPLSIPFGVMTGVAAVAAGFFYLRGARTHRAAAPGTAEVPLRNPFSLWEAIKFCALFAVVLLLVKLTQTNFEAHGLYLVAALAGLTDVDAITLSMAGYAQQSGDAATAVAAIVIAALTNTLVKCGFVVVLGSGELRSRVLPATAAMIAAGLLAATVL
ncbi:MAG TPA: MgtC/SapB family protein [Candidatus Binatia bacterium]|nr:MgtC/SapB family protein [Candidatus Binatia bacterium]